MKKNLKKFSIGLLITMLFVSVIAPLAKVKAISTKASALLVWKCGDNLCKHLFDDNLNKTDANGDYETNYIAASTVKDDTDATITFDPKNRQPDENYLWVIPTVENITVINGLATWAALEEWMADNIDSADAMFEFAYDPCGATNGKNSISTNGAREFRATIYDDASYYGVTLGAKASALTYVPFFWDTGSFNPSTDISGTTLANPAVIESYLLEPNVIISSDDNSAAISNVELASDIPAKAVTITKESAGNFKIKFNSNYYDNVKFKVTSGSKAYYIRVVRVVYSNKYNGHRVLFPKTDTNTYDLIAHFTMKDGSEYIFKMAKDFDLSENSGDLETDSGKNLRGTNYKIPNEYKDKVIISPMATNKVASVSFNVVKAGSTADLYAGTFAGSGNGFSYTYNYESGFEVVANYGD